jgi:hypothetical protein
MSKPDKHEMNNLKKKRWRVRVKRVIEDWVEVLAFEGAEAEAEAENLPGVVGVLKGYTLRGDRPVEGNSPPVGVIDDGDA